VPPAEEIARLGPVVDHLEARGVPVSVDTYQPETQIWCAERGVQMVNDIQGFVDPRSHSALADAKCVLVVMHSVQGRGRATRIETDPTTIADKVEAFFFARLRELVNAGIARERLVVDPGMGYFLGSNPEPSLTMLANLERLGAAFDLPVFASVSRKSFLGHLTGRSVDERAIATVTAELFAATHGADYIRTHDPGALRDALGVWRSLAAMQ
jgi:dihydropteroate synthase type 2